MVIPVKMDDALHKLLKRNDINYYEVATDHFNDKNLEQDLEKIYKFQKKQARNVQILREYHVTLTLHETQRNENISWTAHRGTRSGENSDHSSRYSI